MRARTAVLWTLGLLILPPAAMAQPAPPGEPAAAASAPAAAAASAAPKVKARPKSANVTLNFRSSPASAKVYYGKKLLGTTPFSMKRPRDSGPMDLAVKAGGYFTVNTRVYTIDDETLTIKLTPRSKAYTLFGYKAPIKKVEETPEDDGESLADPETGDEATPAVKGPAAKAPASLAPASGVSPIAPRPGNTKKPFKAIKPLKPIAPATP